MFHCQGEEGFGGLCHAEFISGSLTERIAKSPLLEERDRVRCLTGQEQSEILRSSSADLLQSDGLSLRMTNAFDNHNKCGHPERSEGSLTERTGQFPSPREEGLGERVLPITKVEILKRIIKKCAFTLAEVLITLGIIGVVAAITIPGLNQAYKNQAAATKLRKFHSMMNQAIRMAENDYGDKKDWLDAHQGCDYIRPEFVKYDVEDNPVAGDTQTEKFFNKFFAPYLKISHVKHLSNGSFVVYFPDGSALSPGPDYPTTKCYNWMYFPENPDRCGYTKNTFEDKQGGKCRFSFTLRLGLRENQQPFGFQPFYYGNELPSRAKLRSDCTNYGTSCTALIKYDGWRVAPDYPRNRKIRF